MEVKKKKCKVDGELFTPYLTTDRYCSLKCAAADQKPAKAQNEPGVRRYAKGMARSRDRYTCRLEGYLLPGHEHKKHHIKLEVHHILFLSEFGPDEDWNLVTLCHHCHTKIAHMFKAEYQWRLLMIVNGESWKAIAKIFRENQQEGETTPQYIEKLEAIERMMPRNSAKFNI